MLQTYNALLNNDCLQWLDQIPPESQQRSIKVLVTILDELPKPELSANNKAIEILQKIADNGGPGIDDPVAWQREMRQDNPLVGRE
ncbi:MAG: hypothetical protein VSS75_011450 [Candidatus Parabeggiatoa sp.]|nr:hypothetical protein [Candidatus Parabeggiatoa sp.]